MSVVWIFDNEGEISVYKTKNGALAGAKTEMDYFHWPEEKKTEGLKALNEKGIFHEFRIFSTHFWNE